MINRCGWVPKNDPLYIKYHDEEWGVPITNDQKMFEFIVLESAQAGLSWITVLRKRENYRRLFHRFDPKRVATMTERDVTKLLTDPGVIRNRQKINATINNAKRFLEIKKEFGSFSRYLWNFVGEQPIVNHRRHLADLPGKTKLSEKIAGDLKMRGFQFFGPTVCYAHLQATGLVNDHLADCFRYKPLSEIEL